MLMMLWKSSLAPVLLNISLLAFWLQNVERMACLNETQTSPQESLLESFYQTTVKYRQNSWIGKFCRLDRESKWMESAPSLVTGGKTRKPQVIATGLNAYVNIYINRIVNIFRNSAFSSHH